MTIEEPFEYLSFGRTFARAFQIWFDRFDFFCSIAAIVLVPFVVLSISLGVLLAVWIVENENIPEFHPKHIPLAIFVFGLQFLVYDLATILGRAAIMRSVAKMYVGQPVTTMECLGDAWAKKFPLISVSMIVGFGWTLGITVVALFIKLAVSHTNPLTVFLAVVVAIVVCSGGLYGYIGVILACPAIMIENFTGPLHGIKRSWDLASGSRCYLLCVLFSLWFINNLLSRMLHNMFVQGDIMDVMFSMAGLAVSIIPLLVYFPLHSIMEAVMYLNLRIGRESMNHQVLSGDLLSDASATASRFRNDDYGAPSATMTDYRHVPLVDQEEQPIVGFTEMT